MILKESRGQHPNHLVQQAMSIKSFFLSNLSLKQVLGTFTHLKSKLIEQGLLEAAETEELNQRSSLPWSDRFQPTFYESRCFGDSPNYWSRWTV